MFNRSNEVKTFVSKPSGLLQVPVLARKVSGHLQVSPNYTSLFLVLPPPPCPLALPLPRPALALDSPPVPHASSLPLLLFTECKRQGQQAWVRGCDAMASAGHGKRKARGKGQGSKFPRPLYIGLAKPPVTEDSSRYYKKRKERKNSFNNYNALLLL